MTTEEKVANYKDKIAANVANLAINHLVAEFAAVCAERDELKAKVESLTATLAPNTPAS